MAIINIDSAYLSAHGSGPYILGSANSTYILQQDVTVNTTAFIVAESNIIFDLNNYKITYDNSTPIGVPNGSFEIGTSPTDIPDWDVTLAPGAQRTTALDGMWGSWMLNLSNITVTETVISSAISIPTANVEYTAVITPKGSSGSTFALSVVDTVTQAVLGYTTSDDPSSGYSPVVRFIPTTTNPVQLKIDVTPAVGTTATMNMDYADLTRSRNYGIVVTRSPWFLPAELQPLATNSNIVNFTVQNGKIWQGQGRSTTGSAIYANTMHGLIINSVELKVSGMNTSHVDGSYVSGITVQSSQIIGNLDRVSNRQQNVGGLALDTTTGSIDVEGNTFSGTMHSPIHLSRVDMTVTNPITVRNNTFTWTSLATDGYAILAINIQNFEIDHNTITPNNGRGILFDGYESGQVWDGSIHDNTVMVQEKGNLEYDRITMEATGLRMRAASGVQKNLHFYNNILGAQTSSGLNWGAIGARISAPNYAGGMNNSNILFENNTFKAIVITPDLSLSSPYNNQAWGLSLAQFNPGTGMIFKGNTFSSNVTPINFGDNDSWGYEESDVSFISNTVVMNTTDGAAPNTAGLHNFVSIGVGDWNNSTSNLRLIDMRYQGGAPPGVTNLNLYGNTESANLGWLLDVTVITDGTPTSGALVSVLDKTSAQVYSGITDSSGQVTDILIVTDIIVPSSNPASPTSTDNRGPFTLNVTSGGNSYSSPFSMTGNLSIPVTFGTTQSATATGRVSSTVSVTPGSGGTSLNDVKISSLLPKTTPGGGDLLLIVDVSDPAMAPSGTNKSITISGLSRFLNTITDVSITGTAALTSSAFGNLHVCSGTSANYTVTLPTAVGYTGQKIGFRMNPLLTKLVTLATTSSQQIDGSATRIMWAGESAVLESDGSNWYKISGKARAMACKLTILSNQTVGNGATAKILFNNGSINNTGLMADTTNNQIAILRSGIYNMTGWMLGFASAGSSFTYQLIKNTSTYLQYTQVPSAGFNVAAIVSGIFSVAAGDLITGVASNNTSGNLIIQSDPGEDSTNLCVTEVSPW